MSWIGNKLSKLFRGFLSMDNNKQSIIDKFNKNVKGKAPNTTSSNQAHDGKEGHWLEKQMGISHNSDNAPDLFGYEMKNQTTSGKITFGDWSADEYIFLHGRGKKKVNSVNANYQISRSDFFKIFAQPNSQKNGRLSWSGTPCPTYFGDTTTFGQHLTMDSNGDIIITYNFSLDKRNNKSSLVPKNMQIDNLVIAKWKSETLKRKLEDKFNQNGWFTCTKNINGLYESICFGEPMNYTSWIELFKKRVVFFDSGMYDGNNRPYSQWRATTGFWHSLIKEKY